MTKTIAPSIWYESMCEIFRNAEGQCQILIGSQMAAIFQDDHHATTHYHTKKNQCFSNVV